MLKGVIFDLDGTVADTSATDYDSMRKAFLDYGIDYSYTEYISLVGAKGEEMVLARIEMDSEQVQKLLERKDNYFREAIEVNPLQEINAVRQFLKDLKNVPLWTALATGSRTDKAEIVLEKLNLGPYFDVLITADDVHTGKPDPSVFLKAAEKLNLLPSECLVFEDARMGILAARNAGMKCIALKTSSPLELLSEADLVIDSYADQKLNEYFEKLLLVES